MTPLEVSTSKFLSLVLRHKPESIGLVLDESGWVAVSDLLDAANSSGTKLTLDLLHRVVRDNDKQRFSISDDGEFIRANQGHSVTVNLDLPPSTPPALLYHGTVGNFLDSIRAYGLLRGKRKHVHLSGDRLTAQAVGTRRGEPVILVVDSQRMFLDGLPFFLSDNGVWLTLHVPTDYIEFP